MYLCYLDESGTPDHTSNTNHFVLLGIAFPVQCWRTVSGSIDTTKQRYGLSRTEIHTGWLGACRITLYILHRVLYERAA
jgi:hypothetical protein